MSTLEILVPGVLPSAAGLDRFITTIGGTPGFPDDGLASLFLLNDGSGTAPVNSVSGGAAASIQDSGAATSNAFAWLSGGGIDIEGSEILAMPAIDLRNAFTIVSGGMVTGSVVASPSYQLLAFLASASTNFRGLILALINGGTNWNPPTSNTSYDLRASNGAGALGSANTFGSSSASVNSGRLKVLSHDPVAGTATGAIYDKSGNQLFSNTIAVTNTQLVTGLSGVVQNTVQPCVGPFPSAVWSRGKQNVEAAAVYTRTLAAIDITNIATTIAALASTRGRPW